MSNEFHSMLNAFFAMMYNIFELGAKIIRNKELAQKMAVRSKDKERKIIEYEKLSQCQRHNA